jgi:type 2A phosphatase activator TIP41
MTHMPDMTYANNWLIVEHKNGFALKWNCLEALKLVAKELPQHIKVSASEDWLKARSDCEFSKIMKKPFDWTFTTDYKGTDVPNEERMGFEFEETQTRIDFEKLKTKEDILFYDDIHLFEDELADHGVAQCSVKIVISKSSSIFPIN